MKYYFISDVHGQYDKMIKALNDAGFNPEVDTLISLGDLFDRGPKSKEVLEYVMGCPHHICVWGNHDARLRLLLLGTHPDTYDKSNGVPQTLKSFCEMEKVPSMYWGLQVFQSDSAYKATKDLLWKYFDNCVWGVEFSDLIGVHAWIPFCLEYRSTYMGHSKEYYKMHNWRDASQREWYECSWGNTQELIQEDVYPGKNMIVGHWHAWRIAQLCGEKRYNFEEYNKWSYGAIDKFDCDCSAYVYTNRTDNTTVTLIDGCSNLDDGVVNVVVKETDEIPTLIK